MGRPKNYAGAVSKIAPALPASAIPMAPSIQLSAPSQAPAPAPAAATPTPEILQPGSKILKLKNLCETGQVLGDSEYNELVDDVKEEASKYGTLVNVVIPRETGSGVAGSGRVFCEYISADDAREAKKVSHWIILCYC